jgi:ornithine cyclodeaminase/alanine dehydrogenase-like protein (mu-crystallin family)
LTRGNVIFKCVGIGLMDVVVGNELVRMARARRIGTTIENF